MQQFCQRFFKFIRKHLKIILPIIIVVIILTIIFSRISVTKDTYIEETVKVRDVASYIKFTGNVAAVKDATVMPKVSKTVTAVNVTIGDEVKAGDIIAELDSSDLQRTIKKQESSLSLTELNNFYSIRESQKKYDNYKADLENGENSQILSAKNSLESALSAYESAKTTYERDKMELENNMDSSIINSNQNVSAAKTQLERAQQNYDDNEASIRGYDTGLSNAENTYGEDSQQADNARQNLEAAESKRTTLQQAVDDAQTKYDNAVNDLLMTYYNTNLNLESEYENVTQKYNAYQQAQSNYDIAVKNADQTLQDYADSLEKTIATSNVTTATAELEALYEELDDYKIVAPIDGVITVLNISVGDSVTNTTTAAEVTNYDKLKVEIKISEDNITQLDNGTEVTVSVDAIGRTYKGTIENLSKKATVSNNVSYFTADVTFEADAEIRSGLSAEVKYLLNGVENVVAVSMSALNYNDDNTAYVLVGNDANTAEHRNVTLGISNGTYVEITDGLSEGETILVKQTKTSKALMQMGNGMHNTDMGGNVGVPGGNGGAPAGNVGAPAGHSGNRGGMPD